MPSSSPALYWLPAAGDFDTALRDLPNADHSAEQRFAALQGLANRRLDFMQTRRLDRVVKDLADRLPPTVPRLRLALIGSSTLDHLAPSIRVGGLRRGLLVDIHIGLFGQWRQQVLDPGSDLYVFQPDAVLLNLDHAALLPDLPLGTPANEVDAVVNEAVEDLAELWRLLRDRAKTAVIQQTQWIDAPPLFGHFDRLVPASPNAMAAQFDLRLTARAAAEGILLLDLRQVIASKGTEQIGDPMLWHHAKQTISPMAAPWIGDHVARVLAALRGLSKKVAILDLDNTLWGGVVGDDGIDGIVLGQGSATGEAFLAFQHYLKRLRDRGILLAVSSKNEQAIAEAAFDKHPEMVLRRDDFAAFEANWNDKPSAVRRIAADLDLGLDSFVFIDDNPAERELMRRTLPMVTVPELPEAPELYARCLADAGYFEAVSFSSEDVQRNDQYAANRERRRLQSSATNMEDFLRDLQMVLTVGPFQQADLSRITQLINKTNQFNLTTRRYTEAEVRALMEDPSVLTYASRLTDRFGDNGLTSIIIGRWQQKEDGLALDLDSWLMSCRILGRRVEHTLLTILAEDARNAGARKLLGRYRPTPKNNLVKEHYPSLGFSPCGADPQTGETHWILSLDSAQLPQVDHMTVVRRS